MARGGDSAICRALNTSRALSRASPSRAPPNSTAGSLKPRCRAAKGIADPWRAPWAGVGFGSGRGCGGVHAAELPRRRDAVRRVRGPCRVGRHRGRGRCGVRQRQSATATNVNGRCDLDWTVDGTPVATTIFGDVVGATTADKAARRSHRSRDQRRHARHARDRGDVRGSARRPPRARSGPARRSARSSSHAGAPPRDRQVWRRCPVGSPRTRSQAPLGEARSAFTFIHDLRDRVVGRPQATSDGFQHYRTAIEDRLGSAPT